MINKPYGNIYILENMLKALLGLFAEKMCLYLMRK